MMTYVRRSQRWHAGGGTTPPSDTRGAFASWGRAPLASLRRRGQDGFKAEQLICPAAEA